MSLADFADDVTVVLYHPRRAQWVKDRVKPLATVTHQHLQCQVVSYDMRNVWSSVVLLECDIVGLSLDEQNNIALNNFFLIAYSNQIFGRNN